MPDFLLQPCDDSGPVFREPWEAVAFALVLTMHEQGMFSWTEWAKELNSAIQSAQAEGDADIGNTYYQHWLRALERLVQAKRFTSETELTLRKGQWVAAYLHTPHGKAVELLPNLQ